MNDRAKDALRAWAKFFAQAGCAVSLIDELRFELFPTRRRANDHIAKKVLAGLLASAGIG